MRSISASAISGFVRAMRRSSGTRAFVIRSPSRVQLSGRTRRKPIITGTSSRASVSDTSVWQLAILPSAEAYCGATPTECELLPGRMWMLKPIPQTGVTDGPVEPSSPPHDRGHDGRQHVAGDAAILRQRGLEVPPIFRQVARAAEPGRR